MEKKKKIAKPDLTLKFGTLNLTTGFPTRPQMKFTDGNWLLQPGVQAHYPAEAYDVSEESGTLTVDAPCRKIRHRGDTLQGPVLTVRLSSPLPDVIRVRIEHFSGTRDAGPRVPLTSGTAAVSIAIDPAEASLQSGALKAQVARGGDWMLSFRAGNRVLTRSGWRGMGYAVQADGTAHVFEKLSLGVGECVYGLGERFTAFVKNGQVVDNWNKDGGANSEQAYKSVPFYLTNRGYGVLVNETGPVSFEVASERVSQVQFSLPGESLEYFIIYGPTPKEVLQKLTALTGRPALPPAWSFGLWLSTSFTTSYDEATVTRFIDGMKERDLPLHVFHFDCFWMREFQWCNFEWDERTFQDPAALLRRLHERGLRVCVWINPYIGQRSPLFVEGRERGYLLKRRDGSVWQTDLWQPGMGIVDFTNPEARDWYASQLRRLLKMGVDCFKTDFGERIPTDVVYHDGSDPVRMHNHYSVVYNETVFRAIEEERGKGDAVVFARSSHTSGQRFPVHWGGDCFSNFEAMAESLRGGLSLSLCGFGFWSHDIGGFEGLPDPAVYKRWLAFGLLSSHSRLHGSTSYRVPWNYDDEACAVLRSFTKLKCSLMPYLYGAAVTAHEQGIPVMRPMIVEFPDDPGCDYLDRQYFLGDSLLVVPVFSEDGTVDYYLPEGRWTHFVTGEVLPGRRWHRGRHDFLSLPLFARPGSVIAVGNTETRPDYPLTEDVTFHAFEITDGCMTVTEVPTLRGGRGAHLTIHRVGSEIRAEISGPEVGSWRVKLVNVTSVGAVTGGTVAFDRSGVVVTPTAGSRAFTLTLNAAAGAA